MELFDLIIKDGRLVDPSQNIDEVTDIGIKEGRVAAIGEGLSNGRETIEAGGLVACPGFVDMHVHLRDPGLTYKEDILSGSRAAAAGGVTTIVAMPNTMPVCDSIGIIEYIKNKAKDAPVNLLMSAAMTAGQEGESLADFALYKECKVLAVTDDGRAVEDAQMMRRVLTLAHEYGLLPICHSDDMRLINGGVMNEGAVSRRLGVPGNPSVAEAVTVSRDVLISEYLSVPCHIAHVSCKSSIDIIREAKKRGVKVTCETAPHYFTLTDESVEKIGANARMNPPLRGEEDRAAIVEALRDGTIDVIATDHAPHSAEEKEGPLWRTANGIVGLETSFALGCTYLVKTGLLSLFDLVRLMSQNPSKILEIDRGTLKPGSPADIALVDPGEIWRVDKSRFLSKGKNTPFDGFELQGRVKYTICGGRVVYKDGPEGPQ